MLERLIKFIPLFIIGMLVQRKRILTAKERLVQGIFIRRLGATKQKIKTPFVVAMIGLVGSGKSSVAQELGAQLDAVVVRADDIRVELYHQGEGYDRVWAIAENIATEILERDGRVILDSDFADAKKRASLREKVRKMGAHLVFIRVHCDFDVMSERIRANDPGEIFEITASLSQAFDKGKDVKMRDMIRRTPIHYRWVHQGVGRWVLKRFPFRIFAEIDTTDAGSWKREVKKCAQELSRR